MKFSRGQGQELWKMLDSFWLVVEDLILLMERGQLISLSWGRLEKGMNWEIARAHWGEEVRDLGESLIV